ncbi:hypothetical protein BGZ76_002142 [Entomortierella beljakovae]|nr:hypothetical protein BGZ76_002142 [Entomortierella beljakovae]
MAKFSVIPQLGCIGWTLNLLPALFFTAYIYTSKGPFQAPTCIAFGNNCKSFEPFHMEGTIERQEYYKPVIDYYKHWFYTHDDLGGSLAVFIDGKPVIDVFTGYKDLAGTVLYTNDTLQQVYSSGKAVEGIVIARLVQQGLLDYDAKVTEYWPEFGQNGKEEIRLVDVMAHESGVFHLDGYDLSWKSMLDQKAFSDRLAKQPHYFGGKTSRAYQAVSRGWYLNEMVKRVDPKGRTIGQIAKEELMVDYKDIELHYSQFEKESDWDDRLSPMYDYPLLRFIGRLVIPTFIQKNSWFGYPESKPLHPLVWALVKKWSVTSKALTPKWAPFANSFRLKEAHVTESTSFSLKTNAHSLAKLMSMMANKGASINPGQEPDLISRETYNDATTFHSRLPCIITFEQLPLSRGGWVKTKEYYRDGPLTGVEVQGWGGAGGSLIMWIEELGIGFSYVTNAFGAPESVLGDFRGKGLLERVVLARKRELGLLPVNNTATA